MDKCGELACRLLNCLAADEYEPEHCAEVFSNFRRCSLKHGIVEFQLADYSEKDYVAEPDTAKT